MTLRHDQVSGLLLVALAAFAGWQNRSYPLGTLADPGPGYTPLLIAVLLGVVGLAIAVAGRKSPALADTRWPEAKRAALILLACAFATYALEPLGYRITIAALLIVFLGVIERRRAIPVALVSVGFALLSFYILATLLRVPLPRGPGGF